MRTKVTLVLVFLNVALFFFIFKFERQWRTEAASLEARRRVLGAEAADIRSIQVTSETAGGSFSLVKRQDTWLLSSPFEWPANPHAVRSILDELQLLENENSFPTRDLAKSGQSLAEYGLDTPSVTISFTSGDSAGATPTVLRLGDTTKTGNRLYLLSPDGERIHIVNRAHLGSLMLTLDQLRADTLLTIPVFEAQALNIQTSTVDAARAAATTSVRTSIRLEGGRWKFDAPITDRASKTALEDTINRLNALRPKAFVPPPAGPTPNAAPTLRIGLEGNNRRETLFLGEPVTVPTGTVPVPTAATTDYYAQVSDRSAVFTVTVSNDLIQALRNAPEKLREKRFLDFTPASVTSIILAEPVQPNQTPLTLQRLEAAPAEAAAREGGAWQLVRRGDATQGLQTVPADAPTVQRLLARLARLEAKADNGFVSDNPSSAQLESWGFNRPDREVTLSFPSAANSAGAPATSTLVLQLGTDTNRNVYARVGSDPRASVYAVDSGILAEIPLSALDWRDRQVLTVPANGRVSGVKLVQLASQQTLFDTNPDAAGQPTLASRDPEGAAKLAEQLRSVRAQRFLSGSLTDKVYAGGAERDWAFQLDVTVTLPGGASGSQTAVRTFLLTERVGGTEQYAGDRVLDAVFQIEQPLLDALSRLTLRDPGPPAETPRNSDAK